MRDPGVSTPEVTVVADDLHATLLALIAPLSIGTPLVEGFIVAGISAELGLRIRLTRGAQTALVELAPLAQGLRHAIATDRIGLSYRAGAAEDTVGPSLGRSLCQAVARHVAANEHHVLPTAQARRDAPRTREVHVTSILEPMGRADQRFFGLSPYVGCVIGCRFCYAQFHLAGARALCGLPQVPWGSWVDVRINAAEVLGDALARGVAQPIKFCPIVSDPYQAVEARYHITRGCLEALARARDPPPTLLLTRSHAAAEDLPLLARLPHAWFGVSLPTVDDTVRRHFEPRAATVAQRIDLLRSAKALGLRTIAVVQPILPGPVDALANALSEVADSVRVDVLRGEGNAGNDFDDARYRDARRDAWQREHAEALRAHLRQRGVPLWTSELPPELPQ